MLDGTMTYLWANLPQKNKFVDSALYSLWPASRLTCLAKLHNNLGGRTAVYELARAFITTSARFKCVIFKWAIPLDEGSVYSFGYSFRQLGKACRVSSVSFV